jgi:hypothetical protein
MGDEAGMRDEATECASGGNDDVPDTDGVGGEGRRRQRVALHVEQRQIGSCIAPDDTCRGLAARGLRSYLIVGIEQVIRYDESLRIDDGAARGASTSPAEKDEARRDSRGRSCQIVRKPLRK